MSRLSLWSIVSLLSLFVVGSILVLTLRAPKADELTTRQQHCVATNSQHQPVKELQGKNPSLCGELAWAMPPAVLCRNDALASPCKQATAATVTIDNADFGVHITRNVSAQSVNTILGTAFYGLPVNVNALHNWYKVSWS